MSYACWGCRDRGCSDCSPRVDPCRDCGSTARDHSCLRVLADRIAVLEAVLIQHGLVDA